MGVGVWVCVDGWPIVGVEDDWVCVWVCVWVWVCVCVCASTVGP